MSTPIVKQKPHGIPLFDSWEDAARASRQNRAISAVPIEIRLPQFGYPLRLDLVVAPGKDPYAVYHTAPGVKLPFTTFRPTNREIDSVKRWKAW